MMKDPKILNDFYEKFKTFETLDTSKNINPENTNFEFFTWIDQLKEQLYENNFELAQTLISQIKGTPYLEFEYSWNYLQSKLKKHQNHMNFANQVNATQPAYYDLQTMFTFVFSLLNRLTMLHYIESNIDYFYNLIEEELEKDETANISKIIRNKLKRVTFNNWRYNPFITQYENSFLWSEFLKEARNIDEHYGVLFKIEDPKAFENTTFNFFTEIILSVYLFLFYLKVYLAEYASHKNKGSFFIK
ncbi:hypothetical protein LD119_00059 [Mesoplasma sp. JKS002660]|nr:hypothetical protein [Mesoplasma sp. JKS002661]MCL8213134.1 hypothetical protein [Mesoplasma sp. JKS002660]